MSLISDVPVLLEYIKSRSSYLKTNETLIDIYEGNLLPYVVCELKKQLTGNSFDQAISRCSPVNILKKIIDKLSRIYQDTPVRTLDNENELIKYYEKEMKLNQKMNIANEYFNLCKSCLVQIFPHNGKPNIRPIPNDRFLVYSNDEVDPLRVTHVILIMGKYNKSPESQTPTDSIMYHVYTDDEFIIFNSEGDILRDKMTSVGNPSGVNPYGKLPFFYTSRSFNYLMPKHDTDTIQMTTLIPILLTDLNFAAMYQSFSIVYGINVDDENIKMSPSAFWSFKSDMTSDNKPELGVLEPKAKIDETFTLISGQLSLWLNSKGLKPGQLATQANDASASGISKLVDESDATEELKKQVEFFTNLENEIWDFIINYGHPLWTSQGLIEETATFPNEEFSIKFAEQVPLMTRSQIVEGLVKERDAGFTSTRECIKTLNPEYTDDDIDELLEEIDEEKSLVLPEKETEEKDADDQMMEDETMSMQKEDQMVYES